ncbi:MAG: hypothetical protein LBQ63_07705 [Deltaproteobacteria bacterium]|jgi:Fe-only nitrogenase accessory protein AnfO|nr:hypothetical protein [Deltaproteobacteria bacterium]
MEYASVAVISDRQGKPVRFAGDALALIYRKENGVWAHSGTVPFCIGEKATPARLRESLRDFIAALGETRVLIAASISGLAYSVLDQRGFRLCTLDAFDPECLDALMEALNAPPEDPAVENRPTAAGDPGVYECDLTLMLREYPELSSKKILLPFLDAAAFAELRITCGHVPPWLPPELKRRGFVHEVYDLEDGKALLRVYPAPR